MKYTIPAVIFAGGKSSRMGTDKALLPFDTYDTLSEFQYDKLQQWFEEVYISAKSDKFDFDCQIIKDIHEESSPLVGIVSIFETLETDAVFILSVDVPLIDNSIIKKLWNAYNNEKNVNTHAIIAQSPNGLQPLCGIYKHSILPFALKNLAQNNHRLSALLQDPYTEIIFFDKNTPFINLNTQDDYKTLLHNNLS